MVRYFCQLLAYVLLIGMFWYVCLCSPYYHQQFFWKRSGLGSESSLVCNRYNHLLDDVTDYKPQPICCDNYTATSLRPSWDDRKQKMRPIILWNPSPKQCHGYDSSQQPPLDKENSLLLESCWRWGVFHCSVSEESPVEVKKTLKVGHKRCSDWS